jgi:probable HAF family extracellular repeat protein
MLQSRKFYVVLIALLLCYVFSETVPSRTAATNAVTYTITDLGTFGGTYSQANGINNAGQVVGHATLTSETAHAFLYTSGSLLDLGTLGGDSSTASAVNDSGQVVGDSTLPGNTNLHAFLYSAGPMQDLCTLLGGTNCTATDINTSGVIVGTSEVTVVNGLTGHAFVYTNGTMQDLGTLGSGPTSEAGGPIGSSAYGVNDSGQIVGNSGLDNDEDHGFLYSGQVMQDLGTMIGPESNAIAINNSGQIVGTSKTVDSFEGNDHAVLYENGIWHDLGSLGGDQSEARSINSYGEVVGWSTLILGDGFSHAFVHKGGGMLDLNDLIPSNSGWELLQANGINDAGQIVGYGSVNGEVHAFLLTPVTSTPSGLNVTVSSNVVAATFSNVLTNGQTTVTPILPTSAGTVPSGYEISGVNLAYEITSTAIASGPITIAFNVPSVNDPAVFNNLRVLHNENGVLIDRTVLPPNSPTHDFPSRTIYARVDSLSPFVIARVGTTYGIQPLYDQTKAHRSGSTVPIKLQLHDTQGNNLSAPNIVVTATGVSLASTNAPGELSDAGNANPDFNFRYVSDLGGTGGYIFNLSTRGYGTGTYNLHLRAGNDPVTRVVQFQVK